MRNNSVRTLKRIFFLLKRQVKLRSTFIHSRKNNNNTHAGATRFMIVVPIIFLNAFIFSQRSHLLLYPKPSPLLFYFSKRNLFLFSLCVLSLEKEKHFLSVSEEFRLEGEKKKRKEGLFSSYVDLIIPWRVYKREGWRYLGNQYPPLFFSLTRKLVDSFFFLSTWK